MVEKYYVAVRPRTNDYHSVHKEGCPFLHEDGKKIYLGLFRSGQDAIRESLHSFARTENCLFCCREEKVNRENKAKTKRPEIITHHELLQIPVSFHQGLLCSHN